MKDECGRTIDYLRISVTDLCNYRCRYCMPEEGVCKGKHGTILSVEEIVEIGMCAVSCGVKKIRITGGEPLARRGILDICRGLSRIPGLEELCLTTNGSMLSSLAAPLRQAGVSRLNISLDSLRPERFSYITRRGELADVWKGVSAAEAAGFDRFKFNVVLIGGFNEDEISDFIGLTMDHPWEIRFIELMPMGPCAGWDSSRFVLADQALKSDFTLHEIEPQGVAKRYRIPGAQGIVGLISPMSHEFCGACSRIRLTADGKLKGCLHGKEEIPVRGLHGRALEAAFRAAVLQKPLCHYLTQRASDTPRTMNQIGG